MTAWDKKRMRELTLGCWWPSRPFSSVARVRQGPNWPYIANQLMSAAADEYERAGVTEFARELNRLAKLAESKAAA